MVLLVQKEVADRICTINSDEGKESILSISVKAFSKPKIVAKVPRGAFNPPPNVDSAVILLDEINADQFTKNNIDIRHFFTIVKAGFSHKRKFAINNISLILDNTEKISTIWKELNLDPKIRAEKLSAEHWIAIAKLLS